MKKLFFVIALAAISFGSVYAHTSGATVKTTMQQDTTKKKKNKTDTMKRKKKDTTQVKKVVG